MKELNLYPKQFWALRGYVNEEDTDENGLGANMVFYGGAAGGKLSAPVKSL